MDSNSEVIENLNRILEKEPLAFKAIGGIINHIAATYADKYSSGGSTIETKADLYHADKGKIINIYQCKRYLQRYDTQGFNKSENPVDVRKAVHYLVFELTRLNMQQIQDKNEKIN